MIRKSPPEPIVALDVNSRGEALALARELLPTARWFKIGSRIFTAEGPSLVMEIVSLGASVFLDLKFHDIPSIVAGAVRAATALGVSMMTIHTSGGVEMMKAAAEAADEEASKVGSASPLIVGVTVLTSLSADDLRKIYGTRSSIEDAVLRLASLAARAGITGIVASVNETALVKRELGDSFKVVTPGIRLAGSKRDDQKRVATPGAAREAGSDYVVLGRQIIEAEKPRLVLEEVLVELGRISEE